MSNRLRGRWVFLAPDAPVQCQNIFCRRIPETHPEEGGWIEFIYEGRSAGAFWCPYCATQYRSMWEIVNDGN